MCANCIASSLLIVMHITYKLQFMPNANFKYGVDKVKGCRYRVIYAKCKAGDLQMSNACCWKIIIVRGG